MATKNGEDDLIDIAYSMSLKLASNQDITVRRQTFVTMTKFHPNVYGEIVDYNISIQDEEAMTYSEAVEFCKNKGEGWRLPSKEELLFIYRNRIHVEKRGAKPFGRKDYWSVSRRNNYESFVVSFSTGREVYYSRNIKNVFRCVREP